MTEQERREKVLAAGKTIYLTGGKKLKGKKGGKPERATPHVPPAKTSENKDKEKA